MDLALVVNILTAVTLITGFFFAAYEWRRSRMESRRQAQVLLLRSFDSPEFVRAMRLVLDLPEGLSRAEIEARLGEAGTDLLWYWLGAMESVGLFTFSREIDIRLVDVTFGGPVIVSWQRLQRYVDDTRRQLGRDSMHEWFQWLAEHLAALESTHGRTAAHIRERDWQP